VKARRKRLIKSVALTIALLAAAGAGVWYLVTRMPSFDYGKHQWKVDKLKAQMKKEPCDRQKIVSLCRLMLKAGDFRGAVSRSEEFFQACGEHLGLRRITYESYKRLSEYEKAIGEVDKIIENNPGDPSCWYYRGVVYETKGDLEKAASDYRHSLSIEPRLKGVPFKLASVYERLGRPCEGLFPIEQHLHYYPKLGLEPRIKRQLERLRSSGRCDDLAGKGRALIKFSPSTSLIRTRARVNGKEGDFIIDTGASYVMLSLAFAERAHIHYDKKHTILINTAGGIRTAYLTTLDAVELQGLTSKSVLAAVLTTMTSDFDGALGLSFLSRFSMRLDREKGQIEISAREAH
jgi:aspartyl protease family protein